MFMKHLVFKFMIFNITIGKILNRQMHSAIFYELFPSTFISTKKL